jgi:hypothetical protein
MIRNDHMSAFSMNNLPASVAGFERINKHVVKAPQTIDVREEKYHLRSVIISELHKGPAGAPVNNTSVVTGSSALIRKPGTAMGADMYYIYDPLAPSHARDRATGRRYTMSSIQKNVPNDPDHSFETLAEKQGTVYIYSPITESNDMLRGQMSINMSNNY